ncbi:MAG TPA: type II secretion system protein [Pseudomonadales bacterium]|nr:type II secretion system protein [Pseudomonadales bacterium]
MKLRFSKQRDRAFSFYEILVVISVLGFLALFLLPRIAQINSKNGRIYCLMNLRQMGDAFLVWAGDHNTKFPMQISVANGGAMELATTGNVAACFIVMSNQLSSPKVLICPTDIRHLAVTNFGKDFDNSHISYFVALDAIPNSSQRFVSGDDNFATNDTRVKSCVLDVTTNMSIAWIRSRHPYGGNLDYSDGHAQETQNSDLPIALQQTGLATNRLAIP